MKFERTKVYNIDEALWGMRLPLMSHHKADSGYCSSDYCCKCQYSSANGCKHPLSENLPCGTYIVGPNDMNLAQRLIKGGSEHRKFMRQILVSVAITAPLYWWKEFDTYKVGTVANSTSTMHKITSRAITLDCFEIDDYEPDLEWLRYTDETADISFEVYDDISGIIDDEYEKYTFINFLENLRLKYLETKDKRYWKELVRWLPESWLQTRTVTMNYENLRSMYFQRRHHKLNEWSGLDNPQNENFVKWVESLPYAKELIMYEGE